MCGIAGFFTLRPLPASDAEQAAQAMAQAIVRRGPDDLGIEIADDGRLGLAFRRLAIIDLSQEGHQPMRSASGRFVTVFNGEIYNFREIRERLTQEGRAPVWRGNSDTEVMLAAVDAWGLETALQRFNGMFAFALWDEDEKILHLARDRFGEKPLYLGWCGSTFLFGSEMKALGAHPHFCGEIDCAALAEFMRLGYVPAPLSIFRGVGKLPPATYVSIDARARAACALPAPRAYWSARETALNALARPFRGSDSDALDALDAALRKAVGMRTFADVKVGAFLSGGIDSSAIVAVMQALASSPVLTFTIGNEDAAYNEAPFSAAVAGHLGTRHEVRTVTARMAKDIIPRLPEYYCEPFADSSQIPTVMLAQMARQHVTVALSGDGGDELFGGYNRHIWAHRATRAAGRLPAFLGALAGHMLTAPSDAAWKMILRNAAPIVPGLRGRRLTASHLRTLGEILRRAPGRSIYDALVGVFPANASPVPGAPRADAGALADSMPDLMREIMYLDTMNYLPDDIMTKVDRATMGESLEGRAPFLDPDLFAFAWSLPEHLITDGRTGKLALRRALARYVPEDLFERPKQGFAIPIGEWLRTDLADWVEGLIEPSALKSDGYLDPAAIADLWRAHKSGAPDNERALWHALMFQSWLRNWRQAMPGTLSSDDTSPKAALA